MTYQYASFKKKNVHGIQVQVGMPLVDNKGNFVGTVKEIYDQEFLLDRSPKYSRNLYVPFTACITDGPEELVLDLTETQLDQQGWRSSEMSK